MSFSLTSPSFHNGAIMPSEYTGEGADRSPELRWSEPPAGTQAFALVCIDPDAPTAEPWVHWLLYNIPGDARGLPESRADEEHASLPTGMAQGRNSWGQIGYGGPMPPLGHGAHHYEFTVYALAEPLSLKPGPTKAELLAAMGPKILGKAKLVGTYERKTQAKRGELRPQRSPSDKERGKSKGEATAADLG